MMHKKIVITILTAAVMMLCSMTALAADTGIVESFTGDDSVSLYVTGMPETTGDIYVQIGTSTGTITSAKPLTELDASMKTLVMIDNSLSIKRGEQKKIAELLQNLISDRDKGEQIAIATFSEGINWLTEYTLDYSTLKQAVDGITYQNQSTYLTDVLYELITNDFLTDKEDIYHRIIIISDGVDNKSLGYTKEELYRLLTENPYPVHTVGCSNGKNNEELENMFALSRMTKGTDFLLKDIDNMLTISDSLKLDRNVQKLVIAPSADVMDGSRKTIKLSFGEGDTMSDMSVDVIMPQKEKPAEVQPQQESEEPQQESEEPLQESSNESSDDTKPNTWEILQGNIQNIVQKLTNRTDIPVHIWIAILIAAIFLVALIIYLLGSSIKRNRKKKGSIQKPKKKRSRGKKWFENKDKTVFIGSDMGDNIDETIGIWDMPSGNTITLTDINNVSKSFQTPLSGSIVVGRKKGKCDIVLDYEPSVSSTHCEISKKNGKYYIKDLQSSNGTFVNEIQVFSETEIFPGSIIILGRLEMQFEVK